MNFPLVRIIYKRVIAIFIRINIVKIILKRIIKSNPTDVRVRLFDPALKFLNLTDCQYLEIVFPNTLLGEFTFKNILIGGNLIPIFNNHWGNVVRAFITHFQYKLIINILVPKDIRKGINIQNKNLNWLEPQPN